MRHNRNDEFLLLRAGFPTLIPKGPLPISRTLWPVATVACCHQRHEYAADFPTAAVIAKPINECVRALDQSINMLERWSVDCWSDGVLID
jgi:hypothetical protein